jgi:hypothetical protein
MKSFKSFVRILACTLILVFGTSISNAQNVHFLVSFSPIIPVSFMQDAGIGLISGNIGFSVDITKKLSWVSTVGYNKFRTKTTTIYGTDDEYESSLGFIPITTGIQYFFTNESTRFYVFLKAGYYLPSGDFVKGDLGFTPGVGVQFPLKTEKIKFDISLGYNGVLGAKTKEFTSGSSSQVSTYNYLSYLALNFGFAF